MTQDSLELKLKMLTVLVDRFLESNTTQDLKDQMQADYAKLKPLIEAYRDDQSTENASVLKDYCGAMARKWTIVIANMNDDGTMKPEAEWVSSAQIDQVTKETEASLAPCQEILMTLRQRIKLILMASFAQGLPERAIRDGIMEFIDAVLDSVIMGTPLAYVMIKMKMSEETLRQGLELLVETLSVDEDECPGKEGFDGTESGED